MKVKITLLATVLLLGGCNHIKPIGTIGDTQYHSVRTTDISGPNAVVIVSVGPDGTQTVASFGTSGVLPSAISAGGQVISADVIEPDRTNNSTDIRVSPRRPWFGPRP